MKPATTEDVMDVMESYMVSAALCAAMEHNIFWLLDENSMDVQAISKELNIPLNRCRHWLDILTHIGLLNKDEQGYIASSTARTTILNAYSKDAWALQAQCEREQFPSILDISESISDHESTWAKQGIKSPDYIEQMVESPDRARRFTRMLFEMHKDMADEFAGIIDMSGVSRIMDIGGGSGVMSMALLRKKHDLSAVVIDMKNVCEAGKDIAIEQGMSDRITYDVTNFLEDELPTGFDLILECDLDIHSADLFRKLHESLNSSGRLILIDQFAPDEGMAPPARLVWEFRDSLDDHTYLTSTSEQIQDQLTQAGFKLISEKEMSGGWSIIEAGRE